MKIKILKISKAIVLAICIILLTACAADNRAINTEDILEVHFINVDQADSILLTNSEQAMLIDAGDTNAEEIIIPYIKNLGIDNLDIVIFTHPHKDHIGSGAKIIENFEIGKIYMPSKITATKTFEKLLDSIELKGADIIIPDAGDKIEFGSCDVTVLGPVKEYDEINDNSIVIKLKHNKIDFLFTGDMEKQSEDDVIDTLVNLDADVLKVAHHGSDTSSSDDFLSKVSPKYAVISCGADNDYNHPNQKILDSLDTVGAKIFRTDTMGTIVAKSDGEEITFNKEALKSSQNEQTDKNTDKVSNMLYIGNINSKKFHLESCKSLPAEKNRIYFQNRDEAVKNAYKPCGQCNP